MRGLLPTLGTLRIGGVDIDTLSKNETGGKPGAGEGDPQGVRFLPISPSTAFRPISGSGSGTSPWRCRRTARTGIKDLLDLGYKNLDLSFMLAAGWNEAASEMTLREVSAHGQDMGSVSLTGLLGNVEQGRLQRRHGRRLRRVGLESQGKAT